MVRPLVIGSTVILVCQVHSQLLKFVYIYDSIVYSSSKSSIRSKSLRPLHGSTGCNCLVRSISSPHPLDVHHSRWFRCFHAHQRFFLILTNSGFLIAIGTIATLASVACKVSVSRDWVVALYASNRQNLASESSKSVMTLRCDHTWI